MGANMIQAHAPGNSFSSPRHTRGGARVAGGGVMSDATHMRSMTPPACGHLPTSWGGKAFAPSLRVVPTVRASGRSALLGLLDAALRRPSGQLLQMVELVAEG